MHMCAWYHICMNGGGFLKTRFTTTIEDELLSKLKIKAIQEKVNVNEILEKLIALYLNEKVDLEIK